MNLEGCCLYLGPRRFQRFVLPAEPGQQFAAELLQVVSRGGPELFLPVESAPALDPGQRLVRVLCGDQFGDGQAVLRFDAGLLSQST